MKNKEFFDIVRDIISGALPLWELPRFFFGWQAEMFEGVNENHSG